ncbi:hypothetical protein Tco_0458716 [Tanacetum coccineum]
MRKDLKLGNAMEDSILERSKESPHFKSFWMLLLSLYATQHFLSLQMFQKSTCINSGILFTSMTLFTDSRWTKGRDSNLIWKSSEISSRSALKCINPGELFAALINRTFIMEVNCYFSPLTLNFSSTSFVSTKATNLLEVTVIRRMWTMSKLLGARIQSTDGKTKPTIQHSEDFSTEEPMRKSKRVKRPAKKINKASTRGVVIRETPKIPMSKKKEKKSMRDFHKTRPSRSGTVTKTAPSVVKIKTFVTSEGTGVKPGIPDVTEEESSKSEAGSWGNDEDDSNNEQESSGEDSDQKNESDDDKTQSDNKNESNSEHETDENESGSESDQDKNEEDEDDEEEVKDKLVKTPSNDSDDENEIKFTDKAEGGEDEEMDYTTSQLYDDVDIRLNEPVDSDKGFVPEEGTDAAMTNVQKGDENPEILQVIEDAHVTLSTVPQKTELQLPVILIHLTWRQNS